MRPIPFSTGRRDVGILGFIKDLRAKAFLRLAKHS